MRKKKETVIEIYPECEKPEWVAVNAWCYCYGEGNDVFTIQIVGRNAAFLMKGKYSHGWESFTKLHRNS